MIMIQNKIFLSPLASILVYNKLTHITYHLLINSNHYLLTPLIHSSILLFTTPNYLTSRSLNYPNTNPCQIIGLNWILPNQLKIKISGKSFKIKKQKNLIYFYIGHAQIKYLLTANYIMKKIKKTKILLITPHIPPTILIKTNLIPFRKLNPYTKRGLRLAHQIFLKRRGKITT